jgi:hypothetical protein
MILLPAQAALFINVYQILMFLRFERQEKKGHQNAG